MNTTPSPAKVVTGKVRLSYVNLVDPDEKGAYSALLLIPKSDTKTVSDIAAAIERTKVDPRAQAKWGGKFLASFKTPLRDGDTERDTDKSPEYKGHYFLNVNTYTKPGLVDKDLNEIQSKAEVYSGCYARASIMPAPYSVDGNKGIKFYVNNVQKVADGAPLGGGGGRAQDDFTAIADDFLQ